MALMGSMNQATLMIRTVIEIGLKFSGALAQSVEQQPFKLWVVGSSPTRLTNLRVKLRLARPFF